MTIYKYFLYGYTYLHFQSLSSTIILTISKGVKPFP